MASSLRANRDERARWHWHSVNYERDRDTARRRHWLHRAWFLFDNASHEVVSFELSSPGSLSFRFVLNDDEPIAGHIGLILFTLYWSLGWWAHQLALCKWAHQRYGYTGRELWLYWNTEAHGFSWHLWMRPHEWRRSDAKWRRGSFYPLDFVFGRQRYVNEVLSKHEEVPVTIPGDPTTYYATIALERPVWTRPRWPWWPLKVTHRTADIELLYPIPLPGKGENPWDCGDDATFSMSTAATTVDEAIAKLVASVERDRKRHGGAHWKPSVTEETDD